MLGCMVFVVLGFRIAFLSNLSELLWIFVIGFYFQIARRIEKEKCADQVCHKRKEFLGLGLLLHCDALARYKLDKPTNWPRDDCNPNAYAPLPPIQPLCMCKFLENLHHHNLKNNYHRNDPHKQLLGVYSLEDILLL